MTRLPSRHTVRTTARPSTSRTRTRSARLPGAISPRSMRPTASAGLRLTLATDWGSATLAYRRRLIDAPSYTLNHEEVAKALEEGVQFAEELTPEAVEVDAYGHASALRCKKAGGETVTLPAKSILVAAGTQPNSTTSTASHGLPPNRVAKAAITPT